MTFTADRDEAKKLLEDLARLTAETTTIASLRRDNDQLRSDLCKTDDEISRLRKILMAIRDTASRGLSSSD